MSLTVARKINCYIKAFLQKAFTFNLENMLNNNQTFVKFSLNNFLKDVLENKRFYISFKKLLGFVKAL